MPKPLIGIVAKPNTCKDMWHYMDIVDEIRLVLLKNDALAVGILPTERSLDFKLDEETNASRLSDVEASDLQEIISHLDGIVLEGGLVSNHYEEEFARACIAADVPLLGICSGFNNLVRALGGTVHIDHSIFHNQFGKRLAHDVELAPSSQLFRIFQEPRLHVNSIHTCIAYPSEVKNCLISATCPDDGTVEAIELPDKKFVMGIKWHPELLESMNPIFAAFVAAARSCAKLRNNV